MRVHIHRREGLLVADLLEAEDTRHFQIDASSGVDPGRVEHELAGAVRFTSADQGWVDQTWLRAQCGTSADVVGALDAMVEAAAAHGWVDADTGAIAAHVVWLPDPPEGAQDAVDRELPGLSGYDDAERAVVAATARVLGPLRDRFLELDLTDVGAETEVPYGRPPC